MMKQTGDKISINGKAYTLGNKIGGGLEGNVFEIDTLPNYVVKIINESRLSDKDKLDIIRRLKWLKDSVGANADIKQRLAIPKAILDEDIGYVMVRANEHEELKKYLTLPQEQDDIDAWIKDNYSLKRRLQIAATMFNSLEKIHISGLLFTDLSPKNIMVHKSMNNLVFIDTDNMRHKDDAYIGVIGTEGYIAPEIYHQLCSKTKKAAKECKVSEEVFSEAAKLSVDSDVFSAAIVAFQLLTLQHPFIGDKVEDGTAEEEALAYQCKTDYILDESKDNKSNFAFVQLFDKGFVSTPILAKLFYRTFVDGKNNQYLRPTAQEFYEAFLDAADLLVECEHCGFEFIYDAELEKHNCPICGKEIADRLFLQIFNSYEISRSEAVGEILNDTFEPISDNDGKRVYLSKIVLEEGVEKFLYLRHLENIYNRSEKYIRFKVVNGQAGQVEIIVINKEMQKSCNLYKHKTKEYKPITDSVRGYVFSVDEHYVMFETINSRAGKIQTVGMFRRGGIK